MGGHPDRPSKIRKTSIQAAATLCDGAVGLRRDRFAAGPGAGLIHADHPIAVGRTGSWLEGFHDGAAIALIGLHAGLAVDGDYLHALGHMEVDDRRSLERFLHEILEDRRREAATGCAMAQALRLVVTHIETDHEVRGVTHEPGVL